MKRFIRSLGFAAAGLVHALRSERHMRFHLAAAAAVCIVAAKLPLSRTQWAVLLLAIALVITAELINTAVERAVDLISPELHPLAKLAKDTAAGAVLAAVFFSVLVGFVILGPPLWSLLAGK
ncbi:diacylglycerol kinase family protein [Paenibacillus beijingensis]|uniref:Diacylglycerol kinase n=1 Tax=Paenibacillus beijingensis TaxID=1126833 RepID=A0A0D5NN27_9BACL|nr:diacylglycerol kinase family protein [Paenibacillus beijingensis]AJY76328.1 diacylglycerol kinase [Paenibacillus beijingensis]